MASFPRYRGLRIFDYPKWADPLREDARARAVAEGAELKIDFIRMPEGVSQRGASQAGHCPLHPHSMSDPGGNGKSGPQKQG